MKRRGFLRTVLGLAAAVFSPLAVVGGGGGLNASGSFTVPRTDLWHGLVWVWPRALDGEMVASLYLDGELAPLVDMRYWPKRGKGLTFHQMPGRELH